MIVIQTKEFHRLYCKHVETGSLHGKMAQKAATVITNLTRGLPPGTNGFDLVNGTDFARMN